MKVDVISLSNQPVDQIDLMDEIFCVDARPDLLARVVRWQLAKDRSGTHQSKGRSDVKATSKKMYKQKGGGKARHGNKAAPQFRGGGKAHGPVSRDHGHDVPKQVRRLALKVALSSKLSESRLLILDSERIELPKTQWLFKQMTHAGWQSALVVGGDTLDTNFCLASRNIKGVNILPHHGANVYDILRHDWLIITKEAVLSLEERLK